MTTEFYEGAFVALAVFCVGVIAGICYALWTMRDDKPKPPPPPYTPPAPDPDPNWVKIEDSGERYVRIPDDPSGLFPYDQDA
jgi:hypothetical protein